VKVLLQHPDDDAEVGPWTNTQWDLIVDFGWSGRCYYTQLSQSLGCRILNFRDLLGPEQYRDRLREILNAGLGNILDDEGIDWWDVFIPYASPRLENIMLMSALGEEIKRGAEVLATRPHFLVQALELLQNRKIASFFEGASSGLSARLRGYATAAFELRPSQLLEVAFDKWDTDYRLRRFVGRKRASAAAPAILLPSAYGNVSRVQASYARMLPSHRFLQVVTRKSGRIANIPPNLEVRSLASYASMPFSSRTETECDRLMKRWQYFENTTLAGQRELSAARQLGVFAGFNRFLRKGLRIRDAWLRVFSKETISAVLSGDENNPYTRIPVILAHTRKIPTTFSPHGALDTTLAVRVPCSDTYLAQGEMARDYWVRWCGLDSARVIVGAPQEITPRGLDGGARDLLVFFSEPYEVESGRVERLYKEILPRMCSVAQQTGRQVLVKLHPFESLRARRRVIDSVLSTGERGLVTVLDGLLAPGLLDRAWCGLTVESSTAVDCALHGVPCFLCNWFDISWFGYAKQFARFGVGRLLDSPREILEIPSLIEQFEPITTRRSLAAPIGPEELDAILSGHRTARFSKANPRRERKE
jgi:hypothetical protein